LFEVLYFDGLSAFPDKKDLEYLCQKTKSYTKKADVRFEISPGIPAKYVPTLVWTDSFMHFVKEIHSRYKTTEDTVVIHILYLPGIYFDSATTIGIAYTDYAFSIFLPPEGDSRERSTLLHEFGHLIGLLDNSPRNDRFRDKHHHMHCSNEECVMYWSAIGGESPDFDTSCKTLIKMNGGK
jgi:hypothetical protein